MSFAPSGAAGTVEALRREAARALLGAGLAVALVGLGVAAAAGFGADYALKALAVFTLGALAVWRALPQGHPHARFGTANRITLARLGVGGLLAAVIGEPLTPAATAPVAWTIVVVATVSAVADAFDGPAARRGGLASPFGARFDMEVDAAFTLILCGLVLQFDKAGTWVLAAGLLRYAFVAAAGPWPWLAAPLAPSGRRKALCVVQITALIVCLGPIIPPVASSALAAATLLGLIGSFAVDVRALARRRHALAKVEAPPLAAPRGPPQETRP